MKQTKKSYQNLYIKLGALVVLVLVVVLINQGKIRGLMGQASKGGVEEIISAVYPPDGPNQNKLSVMKDWSALNDSTAPQPRNAQKDNWTLISSIPYQYGYKIDFIDQNIGYLLSNQKLYKTTDGGRNWVTGLIANSNELENFYGLAANSNGSVFVTGFSNSTDNPRGIIWTSTDGGSIWQPQSELSKEWLKDILLGDFNRSFIVGFGNEVGVSSVFRNTNGGFGPWKSIEPASGEDGWFGSQSSLVGTRADISGIKYCSSFNSGSGWSCRDSIDSVFDGAVQFLNDNLGFVGSGTISPELTGWLHRTADGGQTWSERVVNTNWPIRAIFPINSQDIYAVGGNATFIGEHEGGIISSHDGGLTWQSSFDFHGEFSDCSIVTNPRTGQKTIRCVGTVLESGIYNMKVYELVL